MDILKAIAPAPTRQARSTLWRPSSAKHRIDTSNAPSKSWDEYHGAKFHFVITVCDRAKETCPVWRCQPVIAHRGSPDPAAAFGSHEARFKVFEEVASQITARINIFSAFRDGGYANRMAEFARKVGNSL